MEPIAIVSQLDGQILLFLQEYIRNPVLNNIFIFLTTLGDREIIWIVGSLILIIPKKTRWTGVLSLFVVIFTAVLNNMVLKNIFERVRPYDALDGLKCMIHRVGGYSFPSGHAATSFAAATVWYCRIKGPFGKMAIIVAFLIAFSRVYLGVHYPTDIIGGAVLGAAIGYTINLWYGNNS